MKEYEELTFRELIEKAMDVREDTAPLLAEAQRRDLLAIQELAAVVGKTVGADWTPIGAISLDDGKYQIAVCMRLTPVPAPASVRATQAVQEVQPTHALGVYYAPAHDRADDWNYMRRLNPPVVRVLMPGDAPAELISRIHQTAPTARLALRWWDVDDGGEGDKRGKLNNPEDAAIKDAATYLARIEQMENESKAKGLPFPGRNLLLVNSLNEPPSWEHDKRPAIVAYNRSLIFSLKAHGIPVAALCLAVGHPEEWPPVWEWAKPVIDAIHSSPGSVLELHSYWQLEGPDYVWTDEQGKERKDWGALAGRYLHCPYNVPILIGECGADGRLYGRKPKHTGWLGNISAQQYAEQLRSYLTHIHQDARIIAALPFLTDFQDGESWGSFDTSQAHADILSMVQSLPPIVTHPTPGQTMFVIASAGANLRSEPIDGEILIAVPYREPVSVFGFDGAWLEVEYGGYTGWMLGALLSETQPPVIVTPPAPPPTQDNWERSISWVLEKEGGFQNNPADKGNYYNGVLVGTKYGISAASWGGQYDIPNLTIEQAKAIYFENYWLKSGADKMNWPLCLLLFDSSVLHGVGTATKWLGSVGPSPYLFASLRLRVYAQLDNGDSFWRGWVLRVADLLREVGRANAQTV